MLLSIGAVVGRVTVGCVPTALQTIQGSALKMCEQTNLGTTIQAIKAGQATLFDSL
ncbi:MAG: hypothetical protein U9N87_01840 [Planctomycetota bacterium]|nr:hypothetical protein [Planctomycetota bacterium]